MKKLYSLAFVLVALLAVTSCKNEVDDVFGQPAAERISEGLRQTKEVLTSAKNGWCLEFFGKKELGGYNILLKFDADNNVTAASELTKDVNETATSHYLLTQSKGMIISFDTYNKIYHQFSAPAIEKNGEFVSDTEGMLGEVEYRIMRVTQDSVFLEGKKHETKVVMVRMKDDITWANYLTEVHKVEKAMKFAWYKYINGEDVQRGKGAQHTITLTNTKDGAHSAELIPYIIKPDGMHFYKTYTINGKELTGFSYPGTADGKFTGYKDKSVTIEEFILPLNELITEGKWYVDPAQATGTPKNIFDILPNAMHNLGEVFHAMWLGKDKAGSFGVAFQSDRYTGYLYLKYEYVGDTAIKLTSLKDGDGNGNWYAKNSDYFVMPYAFAGVFNGGKLTNVTKEWTITADDIRKATVLTLTDKSDPSNVIVLKLAAVNDPFGS